MTVARDPGRQHPALRPQHRRHPAPNGPRLPGGRAERSAPGGLPWQSLTAFLRIATHPRVFTAPLSADQAADQVGQWIAAPAAWAPVPTGAHADVLLGLVRDLRLSGALLTDAHLAALVLEHGTGVWSTDADFARFAGLRWEDPLRGR